MTPLGRHIAALIASEGAISVARYMALCLGDPRHGYYMTRDPFGAEGDFVTAPEVSQMFGELIGLWCADVWTRMGGPSPVRLVECGPGRGTLMADAVRAAKALPPFRVALDVHLVETSPVLRDRQRTTLATAGVPVTWHERLQTVPSGPALVIANEFFDALPIRQFVRTPDGWRERLVGLSPEGTLGVGLAPEPEPTLAGAQGASGAVLEIAEESAGVMRQLAGRLAAQGGAALAIDYGYLRTAPGDTLQAVRRHRFVDPLAEPGEADLTAHVDFAALGRVAAQAGAAVHGPVTQGDFLRALGLDARAAVLKRKVSPEGATAIDAAVHRLAGGGEGMGELFKVIAVADPRLGPLPGFDSPAGAD